MAVLYLDMNVNECQYIAPYPPPRSLACCLQDVTVNDVGRTASSLQFMWQAPPDSGGLPIAGYELCMSTDGAAATSQYLCEHVACGVDPVIPGCHFEKVLLIHATS